MSAGLPKAGGRLAAFAAAYALLVAGCGGGGSGSSNPPAAQPPAQVPPPPVVPSTFIPNPVPDCQTRGEFKLCISVQDSRMPAETVEHLRERFFTVYPLLTGRFNRAAPRAVDFYVGNSTHIGVADGNHATYQVNWLLQHPEDYDIVVHEIMHIVEGYQWATTPSWLTEGIADYARFHYGSNNAASGWQLQMPAAGNSYTNGYGVAARFLIWLEARYDIELVEMLDTVLRAGTYDPSLWVSYTGKSVDTLWADYVADPAFRAP